jgi:hypothetical protein
LVGAGDLYHFHPVIRFLYILAIVSTLAVVAAWVALGSNTGWTKTSIATTKVDPITEIEFTEYKDGFVPGIDFLGVGLIGSAAIFGFGYLLSILAAKKHKL